ncbi:hypothetical protein VTN02DRAFT_6541 [Thermoascus thermophilus]
MLIDGEKWACEACVRGHRVSSCHHSDRPLTHINKKGRPVSQCAHCRGLRKSRTTHVKCECGDKKKNNNNTNHHNSSNHESDPNTVNDKGDHKQDHRQRGCGCNHGQRCTCALKKEHHLDPVPETSVPATQLALPSEPRKPRLTSTKSEGTLTVFRDGHHKPAHKHNDMAHKCGMPYTIPRSYTMHSTSDIAQRSVDHLPLTQKAVVGHELSQRLDQITSAPQPQRLVKSEHGSPKNAPVPNLEQINTQIPPLDISPFSPFGTTTTTNSPMTSMAFQDTFQDAYFASPDTEFPLGCSAGLSAPPVDWSSFPLFSSGVSAATNSQPPSYSSFDYNTFSQPGLAASSSGELSDIDGLPGLGTSSNDLHDLHSVSDGSDVDQIRFSSASSFIGLPQTQLLASSNLESVNIDDFLKSANESTAALEQQLQASMAMEPKPLPTQHDFTMPQAQTYIPGGEPVSAPLTSLPMTSSPTAAMWPSTLFDSTPAPPPPMEDPFSQQQWAS